MRYTLLFLFLPVLALGQKYNWKRALVPAGLSGLSGAAWAFHETSVHHPDRFPESWDRQFWDGRVSWRNKYRGGSPENGEAFLGSTTFLAWTTDSKHLMGTIHRGALFAAGVTISIGEQRPAWHYLVDLGVSFVAFSGCFHAIYTVGF